MNKRGIYKKPKYVRGTATFDEVFRAIRPETRSDRNKPAEEPRGEGVKNFGYFRVSTARQHEEGFSLEGQKGIISRYAEEKKLGAVDFYVDPATSASKVPLAQREAGRVMITRIRPGDRVLITKIDRAFRNFADFIHWHSVWTEMGVNLHIIDFIGANMDSSTALGRMMVRQLALFAAWESECNRERVMTAKAEKRAQGYLESHRTAGPGFKAKKMGRGYVRVPDPDARRLMRLIVAWSDAGQIDQDIADHLNKNGIPALGVESPPRWTRNQVRIYRLAEIRLQAIEKGQQTA